MTRAEVEARLLSNSAGTLVAVALTGDPDVTPNPTAVSTFLDFPIGDALSMIGYSAVLFSGVTDADLAKVPSSLTGKYLAVLDWQFKQKLRSNVSLFDLQQGTNSEKLSQLVTQLDGEIDRMEAQLKLRYPDLFAAPLVAGRIRLAGRSPAGGTRREF